MEKNEEVAEMAKKVMKRLREEVGKKGLKLSVTKNGKEGKSKMIPSCGFLETELRQCSKEGGVTMAGSVENAGSRLENLGAKEKAKRKKCNVRFSLLKKKKAFQKNYVKVERSKSCCERVWCRQERGGGMLQGRLQTERLKFRRHVAGAAGKKSTTSLSLFMEAFGLAVEEELSAVATHPDLGKGSMDWKMAS